MVYTSANCCETFQLKMVLIKCCDISNEVRPFEVSEPWVDCLLEEYFNQVLHQLDENSSYVIVTVVYDLA